MWGGSPRALVELHASSGYETEGSAPGLCCRAHCLSSLARLCAASTMKAVTGVTPTRDHQFRASRAPALMMTELSYKFELARSGNKSP